MLRLKDRRSAMKRRCSDHLSLAPAAENRAPPACRTERRGCSLFPLHHRKQETSDLTNARLLAEQNMMARENLLFEVLAKQNSDQMFCGGAGLMVAGAIVTQ